MKRKFKLFATIASLCLSVALMAFGVYAATSVKYSIQSTVTFAAQVAGEFNWQVTGGATANAAAGTAYVVTGKELHDQGEGNNSYLGHNEIIGEKTFDMAVEGGNVIYYYITFQNNSTDHKANVSANFTALFNVASNSQLKVNVASVKAADAATGKTNAKNTADSAAATAGLNAMPAANAYDLELDQLDGTADAYAIAIRVELLDAATTLTDQLKTLGVALNVTPGDPVEA